MTAYATVEDHGKTTTAHRWVYEQVVGPIAPGLYVCHSCDNKPCVRPSHLWLGTQSENMQDAYRKGRHPGGKGSPGGEAHPMARLSAIEVVRIRLLAAEGVSQATLARCFDVSHTQIGHIVHNRRWGGSSTE